MNDHFALHHVVGESSWTERTRRQILQAAKYRYPVLISGPPGTGKETVARAIHAHSGRADEPLIPFRAGQLPAPMEAQQLFGNVGGGSGLQRHATLGCFGCAQGGTLVIEEISSLDRASQERLLQILKTRRLYPLGTDDNSNQPECGVRVIATSSRDLRKEVKAGRFIFELLYYLNVIRIDTQPLSKRPADIVPIARHILARITVQRGLTFRQLTSAAIGLFKAHQWPGNIDELECELEQAVLSTEAEVLDIFDFPALINQVDLAAEAVDNPLSAERLGENDADDEPVNDLETVPRLLVAADDWPSLARIEAEHLQATLRYTGYRVPVAAQLLQIDVQELQAKIRRYGLNQPLVPPSIRDNVT